MKFNKIGVEDSLSEEKLDLDQLIIINVCIISIHSSTINWKTEFVTDVGSMVWISPLIILFTD